MIPYSCAIVVSVCACTPNSVLAPSTAHGMPLHADCVIPNAAATRLLATSAAVRQRFQAARLRWKAFLIDQGFHGGPEHCMPDPPGFVSPAPCMGDVLGCLAARASSPLACACRQHPASGVHCDARAMPCAGMTAADLIRKEWKPIIPKGLTWDDHRAVLLRAWARYVQTWRDNFKNNTTATAPADKTDAADLGMAARDLAGKYFKPQTKEGVREAVDEVRVLSGLRGTCLDAVVGATLVRLKVLRTCAAQRNGTRQGRHGFQCRGACQGGHSLPLFRNCLLYPACSPDVRGFSFVCSAR